MVVALLAKVFMCFDRFRIHLRVQDESGEGLLTLYNQQAEHLLDTCAKKLLNRLGIGSNGFPDEIGTLTGRAFVFSVRMPDYFNPDYDYHQHRVVRLYEIDPVPPVSLPPNRPTKVCYAQFVGPFPVLSSIDVFGYTPFSG